MRADYSNGMSFRILPILAVSLLFVTLAGHGQENNNCNECTRRAVLIGCDISDPAHLFIGNSSTGSPTEDDIGRLISSQFTHLAEHSSPCFRLQLSEEDLPEWQNNNRDISDIGTEYRYPGYGFKINLVTGLSGDSRHPENGRPVVSKLTVDLVFLGEQNENVYSWDALGTINTNRTGQTTYFGLDNQLTSLLERSPSFSELAESFEKKPLSCRIEPGKRELDKGKETEIRLSDFRDARMMSSREFNRIVVHASEGEILNGEKSESGDGYRVFRLDELPVVVKYKAPDHGETGSARITVYNSCDIAPVEKLPLRYTGPGEQIGSCDLLINSYDWTGSINLEITQTYNCNVEKKISDLSHSKTRADDNKHTVANITIGMSDFNLPSQGTSAGARLQHISGQVISNIIEDHTTEGYAEKTECFNSGTGMHDWVSPGNWGIRRETLSGQAICDIEDGGVTLIVVKEMVGDKKAMDNMQQEMAGMQSRLQEAMKTMDTKAIENIKNEMSRMVQGDQNNSSIPVKVSLNIFMGSVNYPVNSSYSSKTFNVCTGDFGENESRSETIEMPLVVPLAAEMKGRYTKDERGNDRIEATINDSKPYYATFGSGICPEGTITITGNITLERKKN
ncbi:MAG: hypothetical protein R2727_08485 [Bacteroidales bacterium]